MKLVDSIAAVAVLAGTSFAAGADWPQWRGPTRDNKIADFKAPASWPTSLKQGWKVSVGEAVASPVLAGDKIYAFTRRGKEEVLTCLNAADGKQVWEYKYEADEVGRPASGFPGGESFKGPRSTPAVGNGKVVTLGVGGVVTCLDAETGKEVWKKETKTRPEFYTADSPLIAEGACVIQLGSKTKGELTAFDLNSGEEKWKWTGDGPSYGSPVLATIGDVKQIVILTAKNLVGVGFKDGKLLWQTPFLAGRWNTGTPVIDGDTVIAPGKAFTIKKTSDSFEATEAWSGKAPTQYNTPVLKDGALFGLTGARSRGKTQLFAVDAKTGKTLWEDATARGECGAVLDAGSVLLALSSDSNLIAFKPSKSKFEEVAKYKVAETPTWAIPIVDGNRIFVKDRDSLALWTIE